MTVLRPQPMPVLVPDSAPPLLPRVDPITRLPVLVLYPHSRCNCRCLMCDIWQAKGRAELAPEEIAQWAEEWRALGLRRVMLSGGEALMHRRLFEICAVLHAAGIGLTLLSTGLLLKRYAGEIARYCDDVVVSLDGPRAIHDAIRRVPCAYEKLTEGVAALREAGPEVLISGRCVVQRANFACLRATVEAAHALGLDRLSFLAADVSSEAFNRPGGWELDRVDTVALATEDLPLLEVELNALEAECESDFESGFLAESPAKLRRRLLQYFTALQGQGDFAPNTCNAPWVSSVIEADGTVRPCFFHAPIGNIRESGSLIAVLNAPKARAFRQSLDVQTDPICRRCVCTVSLREEL